MSIEQAHRAAQAARTRQLAKELGGDTARARRIAQLEHELRSFEAEAMRCDSGPAKRYAADRCDSLRADIQRILDGGKG
jgi:hypothetical protein